MKKYDIFIAHAGRDIATADTLYALLESPKRVFLDKRNLRLGDDWDTMLAAAQRDALITVVLCSENVDSAYYAREEIAAAIAMARKDQNSHRVVPLYVSAAAADEMVPYGLRLKHGIIISGETTLSHAAQMLRDLVADLLATETSSDAKAGAPRSLRHPGMIHSPADGWVSPSLQCEYRYKLIAFDLDGTLLRGEQFVFSWNRIWAALKVSQSVQTPLRNAYRVSEAKASGREERVVAYRRWCNDAVDHFKRRRLSRAQLQTIAGNLALTNKCRDALQALRNANVVIAIISGGVDTFLEDLFPDYRDFVDYVFVNRLRFDDSAIVSGVDATAFDFAGKAEALRLVSDLVGCTASETVFVGDHFNDEVIMQHAGLAIAYPPGDDIVGVTASVMIPEDDLTKILPHVLVA